MTQWIAYELSCSLSLITTFNPSKQTLPLDLPTHPAVTLDPNKLNTLTTYAWATVTNSWLAMTRPHVWLHDSRLVPLTSTVAPPVTLSCCGTAVMAITTAISDRSSLAVFEPSGQHRTFTHLLAQQPCQESSLGLLCGQHQSRLLPSPNGDVGFVQDATEMQCNMPHHHFHFISRLGVEMFALNRNDRITFACQLIQWVWCSFYFKLLRLPSKRSSAMVWETSWSLCSQRKQARLIFHFLIVLIEILQSLPTADWWSTSLAEVVLIRVWE